MSLRFGPVPAVLIVLLLLAPAGQADEPAPTLRYRWKVGQPVGYRFRIQGTIGNVEQTSTGLIVYTPKPVDRRAMGLQVQQGSGTGFVVSPDGYVVTCAHVVEDATRIDVQLGEKTYRGKVVASNPVRDLALVKIEAKDLATLPLAKSADVELAQEVRAFGYPLTDLLGESIKVTRGSVSGIVRTKKDRLFQIDAAVNPGNSGGPVVSADGRVVGVTTSKLSGDDFEKVGFAVPVDDVRTMLDGQKVEYTTADRGEKLEGPALARRTSPAVALLKVTVDPLAAHGQVVSLDYSGSIQSSQRETKRIGQFVVPKPPKLPTSRRFSGRVLTDEIGHDSTLAGFDSLPFLIGEPGTLPIAEMSKEAATTWMTNGMTLVNAPADGSVRRIEPRPRFGVPRRTESRTEITLKPATERETFSVVGRKGSVVAVRRVFELETLESPGTPPTLRLTSMGTLQFDTATGLPVKQLTKATLDLRIAGSRVLVPVEYSFERVDLEAIARQQAEARKRAEEERRKRAMAAAEAKAQGGTGDLPIAVKVAHALDPKGWTKTVTAFSPNGKWVVFGKIDRELKLLEPETGRTLSYHAKLDGLGSITALRFTPDGGKLLVGGQTGLVSVFDCSDTGQLVHVGDFAGHAKEIHQIAVSGDGKRVLSGARERVRCWDLATRRELAVFALGGKGVWLSEDGKTGFATDGKRLVSVEPDTATLKDVGAPNAPSAQAFAFSPDGERLYGTDSGKVRVWETETGRAAGEFVAPKRELFWAVAVSDDGKYVTAGGSGRLVTWETARPLLSRTASVRDNGYVKSIAYAPKSDRMAVTIQLSSEPLYVVSLSATSDGADDEPSSNPKALPDERVTFVPLGDVGLRKLAAGPSAFPNNAVTVPRGRLVADGVPFDVGNEFVVLAGGRDANRPKASAKLPVKRLVTRLHVLHATSGGAKPKLATGTRIGSYVLHYEDGTSHVEPVEYGRDLRDFWGWNADETPNAKVAWTGRNPAAGRYGLQIRLFHRSWDNPRPDRVVESVEFRSEVAAAAPFCVAVTVEHPADADER